MKRTAMAVTWLAVYFLSAGLSIAQQTRTWNGPATGDWFTAANWLPASDYPRAGDTVVVTNGSVLLSQPTESLASFSITNATLLFTNWTTRLQAANVTILNKGIMTLPLATATNAMTNRIHVVCETLVVDAGGQILADGKGFKTAQGPGKGVSNGSNFNTGGGHGGKGGDGVYGAGASRMTLLRLRCCPEAAAATIPRTATSVPVAGWSASRRQM
ncbi:MAG: hypothetical protein WCL16_02000 [bacterium]